MAKKQLQELLALREQIKLERIRKEISKNFIRTNSTYLIEGWVLEKNENDLQKLVLDVTKDHIICNFEIPCHSERSEESRIFFETLRFTQSDSP